MNTAVMLANYACALSLLCVLLFALWVCSKRRELQLAADAQLAVDSTIHRTRQLVREYRGKAQDFRRLAESAATEKERKFMLSHSRFYSDLATEVQAIHAREQELLAQAELESAERLSHRREEGTRDTKVSVPDRSGAQASRGDGGAAETPLPVGA